jgi:PiT family inorganic phosphate transporter
MAEISSSWVTSPIIGGVIAALLLFFVKSFVIYRDDKIEAAKRWVPVLIAMMAGGFGGYMVLQLTPPGRFSSGVILALGLAIGVLFWLIARPVVRRQAAGLENRNSSLRILFKYPLIGSAALLSFAHGANDVSNAVGPLSAIVRSTTLLPVHGEIVPPLWVMLIGAFGISVGLLLFGPRLIRLVGEQITKLNPMRAYCVALSTAFTVIVASWFGLPVSTTHIAVGSVFGVGFFREWYTRNSRRRIEYMRRKAETWAIDEPEDPNVHETRRRYLVRRSHFMTIVAAWIITVPASAALAAILYWIMFALFV